MAGWCVTPCSLLRFDMAIYHGYDFDNGLEERAPDRPLGDCHPHKTGVPENSKSASHEKSNQCAHTESAPYGVLTFEKDQKEDRVDAREDDPEYVNSKTAGCGSMGESQEDPWSKNRTSDTPLLVGELQCNL